MSMVLPLFRCALHASNVAATPDVSDKVNVQHMREAPASSNRPISAVDT
jgi:hypothetical protein